MTKQTGTDIGRSDHFGFEDPIPCREVGRKVRRREALTEFSDEAIRSTVFVPGREVDVAGVEVRQVEPSFRNERDAERSAVYRLDIDVARASFGTHAFAPGVHGTKLDTRRVLLDEREHGEQLVGHLPDHLPLRPTPAKLDRRLRRWSKIDALRDLDDDTRWATTVFSPEDRYTFSDTAFPWCTAGRVETSAGGWASGVMVGPRHLLTCSHAIQWFSNPSPYVAGWIKFMPSYFDGSTPFGTAWGTHIYWQQQVSGPTIDGTEARNDYVVVVLDRDMGAATGWMGSRTYSDSWDGGNYWSHIGYPGDISGGTRPTFENDFSLDGDDGQAGTHQAIYHQADVWPGQSGGPMFGWWSGEPWPRVVADQSWQNSSTNGASGGSRMVDLVIRARNEHP